MPLPVEEYQTPSRRMLLLAEYAMRLEQISRANSFNTDVGTTLYIGDPTELGEHDPDFIVALVVGEEEPGYQGEHIVVQLPIEVQAVAKATLPHAWLIVEAVIADIKRAVELEDRTMGGLIVQDIERGPVRSLQREPGSTTVGAVVTYRNSYPERWGAP